MKKWFELKFIQLCRNLSALYKYLNVYQLIWGIGIIVVIAFAYIDRRVILSSEQIPKLSELMTNPIVFVWAIGLVGVVLLLFRLLSIKPFVLIDYFILLIPIGFLVYSAIAYFSGGYVGFKLNQLILAILFFSILFFLRWIIAKMKVAYFNKLKDLYTNSSTSLEMFKTDVPIKSTSEDELDRKEFSEAIAKAIIGYTDSNSLAIGITGEWGSGKSSVVNMSVEYINNYYKDKLIKPCVVEFNPWNFSDPNQLIEQFFKILSDAIKSSNTYLGSKNISDKLDAYSTLLGQVLTSTALTTPVVDFSKFIKNLGGLIANNHVNSLKETRSQLDKAIGEYSGKIIVIVDDIDRLTNIEVRQVFQLVKSIANFTNTIYVLSFDKKVVINSLCSEQGTGQQIDGEKYLEKIIQVDLDIPAVKLENVYFKLNDNLNGIFANSTIDQMRWMNIWYDGFKDFFFNIRDVNRYMNSLRFQFSLTKNQVNTIDLLAIIAIKVFDYTTYCIIRDNINLLAGIAKEDLQHKEEEQRRIRTIIDDAVKQSKYNILALLKRLFPKLESVYDNNFYGIGSLNEWFTENRICHPERFQLYFQLDISKDDISPFEIDSILQALHDEILFRKYINDLIEDGRILRFLEVFQNYTSLENKVPTSTINTVLTVLLDEGDKFPNSYSSDLIVTELKIARITYQLCKRFSNQLDRGQLFLSISDKVNNSLYPLIYDIYLYDQEHGRYGLKKNPEPEEYRTFSTQDLDLLEQKGLSKIREWSTSRRLEEHRQLRMLLHVWKTWANVWGRKEEVNQYLEEKIVEDSFLINFIGLYINTGRTQAGSNYGYTEIVYYDLADIKRLLNGNFDLFCKRVEKINRDVINEEQIKILNMFEDALKGKNLSPWGKFGDVSR
ncbi:KAP family P-loop NTPase fold protein [Sporomusa termitida]|uniref:KAP family P-loop domain protein n=1 Tax=Sporomusa termitida TaxID=2377 RepID=A0A517E032_9FIRM|nr:P-loop NTPase fold protein [Sporomusa termitida]QDR82961.1 KAP family P-loop domain protein [Sporomusa termitida]